MTPTLTWMVPGLVGFACMFHASRALYALERGRAAIVANVVGWGRSRSSPFVGARHPAGHDPGTLAGIGAASASGCSSAAPWRVVALRRAAGRAALAGLARAAVVLVGAARSARSPGAGWSTRCRSVGGDGVLTAIGAAAGGAVVAALVVGAGAARRWTGRSLRLRTSRSSGEPRARGRTPRNPTCR